jgi:hypothetical protein
MSRTLLLCEPAVCERIWSEFSFLGTFSVWHFRNKIKFIWRLRWRSGFRYSVLCHCAASLPAYTVIWNTKTLVLTYQNREWNSLYSVWCRPANTKYNRNLINSLEYFVWTNMTSRLYIHITTKLNPWRGVHLVKLVVFQLVKQFPVFYGNRRFIAVYRNSHNSVLSRPK